MSVVNTIIVKDFSRLGRDYIGVGDYVEQIFPLLGVRFIAINNHFDSGSQNGASMGLGLALENLVNAFYAKDCSNKSRSANRVRWKNGYATSPMVPFGYYWNSDLKGQWNIDTVSSKYVRYIFDLALEGNSTREIASVLNEEGIPTPNVYNSSRMKARTKEEKNLMWPYNNSSIAPDEEQLWDTGKVRRILKHYEYTGALVMNKRQYIKSSETGKYSVRLRPETDYVVTEGAHEAIITKEEFEKAQEVFRTLSPRGKFSPKEFPLKSKIRCGNGRRMLLYRKTALGGIFICKYADQNLENSGCCSDRYPEDRLNAKVLNAIERVVSVAQVLEIKLESRDLEAERKIVDPKRIETQIRVMKEERIRQYEGYADGMITRKEYLVKKEKIDGDIKRLEAELVKAREVLAEEQRLLEEIKKIGGTNLTGEEQTGEEQMEAADSEKPEKPKPHVLTRALVEAFIDTVYVYDSKHIEIVFKCEDVMKAAMDRTSGGADAPETDLPAP